MEMEKVRQERIHTVLHKRSTNLKKIYILATDLVRRNQYIISKKRFRYLYQDRILRFSKYSYYAKIKLFDCSVSLRV